MNLNEHVRREEWERSAGDVRSAIEAEVSGAVCEALRDVDSYVGLYRVADAVAEELRRRGFALRLFDEDGECMVTLVEARVDRTGLVVEFAWDEDEGANALVQFPSPADPSTPPHPAR